MDGQDNVTQGVLLLRLEVCIAYTYAQGPLGTPSEQEFAYSQTFCQLGVRRGRSVCDSPNLALCRD